MKRTIVTHSTNCSFSATLMVAKIRGEIVMSMLTIENVSKGYMDKPLFKDISLTIKEDDKLGLIGSNGSGKSTLVGIISGTITADTGKRTTGKEIKIHYLPQDPNFDHEGTIIREVFHGEGEILKALYTYQHLLEKLDVEPANPNIINEISKMNIKLDNLKAWELESNAKSILNQLGIEDLSKKISQLSGGEKKRVALARALITPCDLLILDEPTNHLDTASITFLEEYLSKRKGALLLITHDRYFLDRVVNQIIELDRGSLFSYKGNYSNFLELKAMREEDLKGTERKHKSLLRKELAWIRQGAKARSTKQKFRKERYEELKDKEFSKAKSNIDMDLISQRLGKKVIELEHISKAYEKGQQVINDFSYTVLPNDRIGIIGKNGTGKSTLLNIIAGKMVPDHGEIAIGETVKIGYYDQESTVLDEDLRVIEYIRNIRLNVTTQSGETISASQMLERFLFPSHLQWTHINRLSGGEKRRLYLLGILMEQPNVLLLDEPTNDLDIETLTILEDFLEDFPGAVIIISHDRYFLDKCADHLFSFGENGSIARYVGTFSEYIEENPHNVKEKVDNKIVKQHNSQEKVKVKFSYKEQKEYDEIQGIIEELQNSIDQGQKSLAQCGTDYVKLQQLQEEIDKLQIELDEKMERWIELEEKQEQFDKIKNG